MCRQILRVVLGETVVGFGGGGDGGRDGFYTGVPAGALKEQYGPSTFIVQCKHTSQKASSLVLSTIAPELPKLRALAAQHKPVTYIVLTNRRLTAESETEIRTAIRAIPGVENLLILNEEWIEGTIDAEPRLLRLVPRLYGIGDLSQILSFPLERQSRALFDALLPTLTTFVPTDSYRTAEKLLTEGGMVVLVGPPASGKSTIAANLCAVWAAQTKDLRAFKLDKAEHFTQTWSADDSRCIYWVDDIFGETTLDDELLRDWSRCLNRLDAAVRNGAMVVVGTRDYILKAAEERLKADKAQLLRDASIRVQVDNLQSPERRRILYNHVKHGDLTTATKSSLKRFLPDLAELRSFTPELARRLGHARFHRALVCNKDGLTAFFDNPVEFFAETMAALAPAEMAALTACLLHNNSLPDPVPEEHVSQDLRRAYGVDLGEVRRALERLEGTFSRRQPGPTGNTWRLHHPSMTEALQTRLRSSSAYFELYLRGAELKALLRDTSTLGSERLVLIPQQFFPLLVDRLTGADATSEVVRYLVRRGSDAFLRFFERTVPDRLDELLVSEATPGEPDDAVELGCRLNELDLLTETRRESLWTSVQEAFEQSGAYGFLEVEGMPEMFGVERTRAFLAAEVDGGYEGFARLYDWLTEDMSSVDAAEQGLEVLERYHAAAAPLFSALGVLQEVGRRDLEAHVQYVAGRLQEKRAEIEDNDARRAEYHYDHYKESWREERYELEHGLFSDVDE